MNATTSAAYDMMNQLALGFIGTDNYGAQPTDSPVYQMMHETIAAVKRGENPLSVRPDTQGSATAFSDQMEAEEEAERQVQENFYTLCNKYRDDVFQVFRLHGLFATYKLARALAKYRNGELGDYAFNLALQSYHNATLNNYAELVRTK